MLQNYPLIKAKWGLNQNLYFSHSLGGALCCTDMKVWAVMEKKSLEEEVEHEEEPSSAGGWLQAHSSLQNWKFLGSFPNLDLDLEFGKVSALQVAHDPYNRVQPAKSWSSKELIHVSAFVLLTPLSEEPVHEAVGNISLFRYADTVPKVKLLHLLLF